MRAQPAPARHPAPTPLDLISFCYGKYSQGMAVFSTKRTGSPSAPPGPTPGAVRPWASAAPAGAAARSAPTTHQATVPSPWHTPPWLLFCFLGCLRDVLLGVLNRQPCLPQYHVLIHSGGEVLFVRP